VVELRLQEHTIEEIAAATLRPARTVRRVLSRFKQTLANRHANPDETPSVSAPAPRRPRRPRFDPQAPLDYADFKIRRLIGTGGMGKVYAALQKSLEKPVAIKALHKVWLDDPRAIERFVGEARTAARLRHPNIVDVHGIGRLPGGGYFMVMDLVEGRDLARLVTGSPPSSEEAAAIVATVADTIDHAHQLGVIHCDLKPGNVLIDNECRVFVNDFGLARSIEGGSSSADHVAGTAAFMAPEQFDASFGDIGPSSDVYGLGGILYVLLVGHPPFTAARATDIFTQVTSAAAPPDPCALRPEIPIWLSEICRRCLMKAPPDRFATAREVAEALRAAGEK
jgi:serine/threonine protein kinase